MKKSKGVLEGPLLVALLLAGCSRIPITSQPKTALRPATPKTGFPSDNRSQPKLKVTLRCLPKGFLLVRVYDVAGVPVRVADNFGGYSGEFIMNVPGWNKPLRLWTLENYRPPESEGGGVDSLPFMTRIHPGQFLQYIVPINHLLARPRPGHLPRFTIGKHWPVVFWYQWRHWIMGARLVRVTAVVNDGGEDLRSNTIAVQPKSIRRRCYWGGELSGSLHFYPVERTRLPKSFRLLEKKRR